MSVDAPSDWADRLRTPPLDVLRAWTEADADAPPSESDDELLTIWTWLASVLPDAVRVVTGPDETVVRIGVLWLHLHPVPRPGLADAGWPDGAMLVLSGPGVSAVALPADGGSGWVVSRSADPDLPTLVAAAPTLAVLHRELAHRVWHRCVDLLLEAGDEPVDPRVAAAAAHDDVAAAVSRGWREQLLWVPAVTEGVPEWSVDLDGVPTGSWLDATELPRPYRLEARGAVLRALEVTPATP